MAVDWSQFDRGVFLVNCLAIVYKNGRILIGRRKNDEYIKELTWSLPGGRPTYDKSLEESLKDEVKKKTGLKIKIIKLIFARIVPEKPEFFSLYYLTKPVSGKEKAGEKFKEIKWVKPTEVGKYFKTSVDPFVMKFLRQLERSSSLKG